MPREKATKSEAVNAIKISVPRRIVTETGSIIAAGEYELSQDEINRLGLKERHYTAHS